MQVTIGGEPRTLGDFSAYKAFKAMETVAQVEEVWRAVLSAAAAYKREYEAENYVELDRSSARRHFAPIPLWETVHNEDGTTIERPALNAGGEPIVGPDPLAHLSEGDWEASGQKLRLPDSPSEQLVTAHMIPVAFKLGRDQVLRLLAIATVSNADIEKWDADGVEHVDTELDKAAHELLHRCKADELLELAAAALEHFKAQVAGPFEKLVASVQTTFRQQEAEVSGPRPMTVESTESTGGSPDSAPGSADASDGDTATSPTEHASASSVASPSA
jgi:hypothetical protein